MRIVSRVCAALCALSCDAGAEPVTAFGCRCAALTDTDQPTTVELEVCALAAEAAHVALGRASTEGHMTVQSCDCVPKGQCPRSDLK